MRLLAPLSLAATLLAASIAAAACPSPEQIDRLVADWQAKRPAGPVAPDMDMTDAYCAQEMFVERLKPSLGEAVGYKAGLTAKPVQERFGATEPARGVLLEKMLLPDGASVPANFGARPVWEADMLLVIKDEGINTAGTPEEAVRHVAAMRPFIELPDLVVAPDVKLDAPLLTAINVGARAGVTGPEVPLPPTAETVKALENVRIVATDASGAVLAENSGAATLGNPLNALLWLARNLKASGRGLRAGDLVSVGSFSPLVPPKPGQAVTVRYEGLPGTPQVSVRFE